MGISGNMRQQNQAAQMGARRFAKKFIKEGLETFDFREDKAPHAVKMAAIGERLWANRLRQLGYQLVIPLQSTPIGSHGPDIFAARWGEGRISIAICEVKALQSSVALAALDRLADGTLQMSMRWLRMYADMLIAPMMQAITSAVGAVAGSVYPMDVGFTKRAIEHALARAEFDLYLLRARQYEPGWKLKGFKLLHAGEQDVRLDQIDSEDPIQSTFPSAAGRYIKV